MEGLTLSIIQDFINGDEDAFANIYKLYYKDVRLYCYKHTRSPELADELTSDVFMRLWESRTQLDPEREIKPYLFTITKNVTYTWLKRNLSDHKMKEAFRMRYLSDQDDANQHEDTIKGIDLSMLRKLMDKIPAKRKLAFELCKIDGHSYIEAANMLSVSRETIKEHVSLAKKDLSRLVDASDYLYIFLLLLSRYFYH